MLGANKTFSLYTEKDIKAKLDAEEASAKKLLSETTESSLAGHLNKAWERNRRHRDGITDRLLDCTRARLGEYGVGQLAELNAQGGASPIYIKLTGTKCRAASAWIRDVMMPAGERSYGLTPTAIPDLPTPLDNQIREQAKAEAISLMQMGILGSNVEDVVGFFENVRDKALKAMHGKAAEKSKRMEQKISDMMDEGDWDNALEEFIEDFVTYPTAYIKGPFIKKKRTLTWGDENQGFAPVVSDEILLGWKRVSPYDIYPAPYARNLQEGDFIEHIRFTKSQIFNLIGIPGYDEKSIRECLNDYDMNGLQDWLWQDYERDKLEQASKYITSDKDTIDAVHYWGNVKGEMLADWGITGLDNEKQYPIDAILIGRHVIRAEINDDPIGSRPYHHACWDAVPGSLWGIALPEQMADHQRMINACARALSNNMALASGPQAVVVTDMLAEGENIRTMVPFKVWQAKLSMMNTSASIKPIEFFQPKSNAAELLKVMEDFERRSDDVTNVPRYSYGNERIGGAGSTASGLNMLMTSAAKGIRRAIANIDSYIIKPTVQQAFKHVMLYDPDISLKGDCKIIARGASALLIKEQSLTRVQTFLAQTANPIDMQIIGMKGRAALLREVGRLMDLPVDKIVPTEEEVKVIEAQAQMQAQAGQEPPSAAPDQKGMSNPNVQGAGNQEQMMQNKLQAPSNLGAAS